MNCGELLPELRGGNPKHALDAISVAHTNLNVGFFTEPRAGVNFPALGEDTFDGVEGGLSSVKDDLVESINDCAVQIAAQHVGILAIFGKLPGRVGLGDHLDQRLMGKADAVYPGGSREIETKPKVDDRADNRWGRYS